MWKSKTNTGHVVYKRKPNFFRIADLCRIEKKVELGSFEEAIDTLSIITKLSEKFIKFYHTYITIDIDDIVITNRMLVEIINTLGGVLPEEMRYQGPSLKGVKNGGTERR